ncbi:hypothetical protein [Rhodococcus sp. SORGH_AS_0301]|uniref:hypothetical protein n=1 Tax=Rhodococcus sp. SORGH_AS_0301 TaxID=3041780 RepID=UPI00277FB35E|nr:hypothetical protein [Rhodococcus sp. SORGH_AS_0301]MDQ1181848.1 hypothetical protein [Rhodococcus sp. SORGH_AS_0301]
MSDQAAEGGGEHDDRSMVAEWVSVCAGVVGAAGGAVIVGAIAGAEQAHRVVHVTDAVADRVADLFYIHGWHLESGDPDAPVSIVAVGDPSHCRRWPLLTSDLEAMGVHSVDVAPMAPGGSSVGVLVLYRTVAPSRRHTETAGLIGPSATLIGHLVLGLDSVGVGGAGGSDLRSVAVGVLMARHDIDARSASARLRAAAYARGTSTLTEACRIVDSTTPNA